MYIKMRTLKDSETICMVCGNDRKHSLELFEVMFNKELRVTICDQCNEKLLQKTLKAACKVQERTKSKEDLQILQKRRKGGGNS